MEIEAPGVVRVGVDVGGTFTDLVALAEDGTIEVRKVVTTPVDPTVALFKALDALSIEVLIHGTTIATNALLERRGARVALVTTKGFEDLLWLRRQDRAALYDLGRDHPPPLVARSDVVGVGEQRWWQGKAEFFSRFQVYDEFDPGWPFDRKIRRVCTLQNLVNKNRRAAIALRNIGSIGQ